MPLALHIGLDLGSDTLKAAYAYEGTDGISYGKLMKEGVMTEVALPAIAYYDEAAKQWEIESGEYTVNIGNASDNITHKLTIFVH